MILSVVGSVVFIAVTGLAVDYGNAVVQEAKLQKATETAVLAGIQEIPYQQSAMAKMKEYFEMNYEQHDEVNIEYHTAGRSCWVVVDHPVNTYFMRVLGQDTLTVNARAKAELQPIEGFHGGIGVSPFVLLNPSKNGHEHDNFTAANHGKPYLLKYGSDNIMAEDWYFGNQILGGAGDHIEGRFPVSRGWRSPLALDPNSESPHDASNSANAYRTNIREGWKGRIMIGDILDSNPGNMAGPTRQGRSQRLSGYETVVFNGFDPNLDPTNPRIVIVPVVSLGQFVNGQWQESSPEDVANGNYDWKHSRVDAFAAFFLLTENEQKNLPGANKIDSRWLVGRYMHGVNIGGILESGSESSATDLGMYQGRLVPF